MKHKTRIVLSLVFFSFFNCALAKISATYGDFEYNFSGVFKPEMFYAKNSSLLNNNNNVDKLWFERHNIDFLVDILYGAKTYQDTVAEFFVTIRNKAVWGNTDSIARTSEAETKLLDAVGRGHRHSIPRHIFWMREAWLRFNLSKTFDINFGNNHSFTLGAFPFDLGRGIALGNAFAVGPENIGFYADSAVDQYAFGAKFSGGIVKDTLYYDLYAAILQNKSSSLADTGAKVYGQEFGRLADPARGFGKINYLIAGRLFWEVFNNEALGLLKLEPYALYNSDPEQRVEFTADASSKLGTVGLAGEYYGSCFELGFDWALNLGQQRVKGFDRNQIIEENRNGSVILVNSHVVDQNGKKVPFTGSASEIQRLVNSAPQNEVNNGAQIGQAAGLIIGGVPNGQQIGILVNGTVVDDSVTGNVNSDSETITLKNADNRFRNPFTNKYEGWMFVIDAGVWVYKKDLQIAVTAGITSGDNNPNLETKDGVFSGFIPLQEVYSGKRVKSAFLLGSAGKVNIPLSTPTTNQAPSRFADVTSGFTNLVFTGLGMHWLPSNWDKPLKVNPNVMIFWQDHPSLKFDPATRMDTDERASTFLGVETNLFVYYNLLKDLKIFFVGSIFFPGQHFTDVKGRPLNSEQDKQLDRLDRTGFDQDRIPNLGDDKAYTFNIGLEFYF